MPLHLSVIERSFAPAVYWIYVDAKREKITQRTKFSFGGRNMQSSATVVIMRGGIDANSYQPAHLSNVVSVCSPAQSRDATKARCIETFAWIDAIVSKSNHAVESMKFKSRNKTPAEFNTANAVAQLI